MENKPALTTAAMALEKKIDMTLDDIIKMSQKKTNNPGKARMANKTKTFSNYGSTQTRASNVQKFLASRSTLRQGVLAQRRSNFGNNNQFPHVKEAAQKLQGVLAQRRSNFGNNNQSTHVKEAAQKAARNPIRIKLADNWHRGRPAGAVRRNVGAFTAATAGKMLPNVTKQRPQTLDSLFANMKEQRIHFNAKTKGFSAPQNQGMRGGGRNRNSNRQNNRGQSNRGQNNRNGQF